MRVAADILKDAEVGIDPYANYNYIRNFTPKPMATLEVRARPSSSAACSALGQGAVGGGSAPKRVLLAALPGRLITL